MPSRAMEVSRTPGLGLLSSLVVALFAFAVSMSLLGAYTAGDQLNYRAFYDGLPGASLDRVPIIQAMTTGSAEPIYGYLMWLAANAGIGKDVIISVLNAVFAVLLHLFLRKHRAGVPATLLLFTNFYLVTLFTSLERLKLAYIFLLAATLLTGWKAGLAMFLSMAAHFQSLLMIVSTLNMRLASAGLLRRHVTRNELVLILLALPFVLAGVYLFATRLLPGLQSKFLIYLGSRDIVSALANIGLLVVAGMVVLRRKMVFLFGLAPIAFAAILFGPTRINIMAVTLLIYLVIVERRSNHPVFLILLLYFSVKSIPFLQNIYTWGDGYYGS